MQRIKISAGSFSLEYEGEQSFIEDGLLDLLARVIEETSAFQAGPDGEAPAGSAQAASVGPAPANLSTNTIAQILDSKTGSDLALCSVAKINLVDGKDRVTRAEILDAMRSASVYFKDSYVSNLTAYLVTLTKSGRINMIQRNTYALAASERRRISEALRGAGASGL